MNNSGKIIVSLAAALSLAGCVAEQPGECPEFRLAFRYTFNSEQVDRLTDAVRDINIYAFDAQTGVLVGILEASPEDIARGSIDVYDLPDGRYTFVAWGGDSDDMSQSFTARHLLDAENHRHADITIGETTLDDFCMMLDYETLPEQIEGDIAPASEAFDDLFFARAEDVTLLRHGTQTVEFDFIRNASVLKVSVRGLENIYPPSTTRGPRPDQPLRVFVTGKNGRYRWDNTIDPYARSVRYEPPCHTLSTDSMEVDIKTLRLDVGRHSGEDAVLLHVQDADTGRNLIAPLDILASILQTRSTRSGELLYPDQDAIDRQYEFPITISLGPIGGDDTKIGITVSINDWQIVVLDPITELL